MNVYSSSTAFSQILPVPLGVKYSWKINTRVTSSTPSISGLDTFGYFHMRSSISGFDAAVTYSLYLKWPLVLLILTVLAVFRPSVLLILTVLAVRNVLDTPEYTRVRSILGASVQHFSMTACMQHIGHTSLLSSCFLVVIPTRYLV